MPSYDDIYDSMDDSDLPASLADSMMEWAIDAAMADEGNEPHVRHVKFCGCSSPCNCR